MKQEDTDTSKWRTIIVDSEFYSFLTKEKGERMRRDPDKKHPGLGSIAKELVMKKKKQ